MQVPLSDAIRSGQEQVTSCSIEKDACLVEDWTLAATPGGDINEKDASNSSLSWEEIVVLLKEVPCFTTLEPLAPSIDVLFSLTCRHFVDLLCDSHIVGMVHLPHGTPEFVLQCTYLMQKYTTEEMTEMVRFAPSLPKFT